VAEYFLVRSDHASLHCSCYIFWLLPCYTFHLCLLACRAGASLTLCLVYVRRSVSCVALLLHKAARLVRRLRPPHSFSSLSMAAAAVFASRDATSL